MSLLIRGVDWREALSDSKVLSFNANGRCVPRYISKKLQSHFLPLTSNIQPTLKNIFFLSSVMLFIMGLPVIECIIFCLAIGRDPQGLTFAVVNKELNRTFQSCENVHIGEAGGTYENLACLYLKHLGKRNIGFVSFPTFWRSNLVGKSIKTWNVPLCPTMTPGN